MLPLETHTDSDVFMGSLGDNERWMPVHRPNRHVGADSGAAVPMWGGRVGVWSLPVKASRQSVNSKNEVYFKKRQGRRVPEQPGKAAGVLVLPSGHRQALEGSQGEEGQTDMSFKTVVMEPWR